MRCPLFHFKEFHNFAHFHYKLDRIVSSSNCFLPTAALQRKVVGGSQGFLGKSAAAYRAEGLGLNGL